MMSEEKGMFLGISFLGVSTLGLILFGMWGCPQYAVYEQRLSGEAELAKATYNRQVKVREAEAVFESAKSLANAEIERARGVAEANKIIGTSLKNNNEYLKWLYIEGLKDRDNLTTIYVPTEAGLPILEAGKRK